jgi:phage/plasmid primase-like uncharacterized protein
LKLYYKLKSTLIAYTKMPFIEINGEQMMKCNYCGNIWDGYAQCNCWKWIDYAEVDAMKEQAEQEQAEQEQAEQEQEEQAEQAQAEQEQAEEEQAEQAPEIKDNENINEK